MIISALTAKYGNIKLYLKIVLSSVSMAFINSQVRLSDKYDRQSFVGIVGLILSSPSAAFYKDFQAMDSKMLALVLTGVFFCCFFFGIWIACIHVWSF
ncbi:hypothetical protein [Lactococcus garvieae]|uniref:hypothetical protein n=1 Tax=Lactococcus garvieae TaxID=1363 RepID=UPI0021B06D4E|nr:hypothetical protein [Lactococcus garvieae]